MGVFGVNVFKIICFWFKVWVEYRCGFFYFKNDGLKVEENFCFFFVGYIKWLKMKDYCKVLILFKGVI